MSQNRRIALVIILVVGLIAMVLGIEMFRRGGAASQGEGTAVPGAVPIYHHGDLVASFTPQDLEMLAEVSFVDAEEGKTQSGWLLRDVLLLHFDPGELDDDTQIVVTSSSRGKQATLTWAEVNNPDN